MHPLHRFSAVTVVTISTFVGFPFLRAQRELTPPDIPPGNPPPIDRPGAKPDTTLLPAPTPTPTALDKSIAAIDPDSKVQAITGTAPGRSISRFVDRTVRSQNAK